MADERVQAAIRNWAGRFIANGIDYNDFVATTAAVPRWEDWLHAWTATAEWVLDPALHRRNTEAAVRSLASAHELLDPTAERIEAPLSDGGRVVANLRRPAVEAAVPLVVLIPGLDSTKEEFFHWESVFLDRGMATLSLDGPGQGETGFALDIRPDYEVAVAAILDEARRRAGELNLAGVAELVTQPCLVITGRLDRVIAWQDTHRIAQAVPGAEWRLHDDGSHVCNNIPYKYRPQVADWIGERLAGESEAR